MTQCTLGRQLKYKHPFSPSADPLIKQKQAQLRLFLVIKYLASIPNCHWAWLRTHVYVRIISLSCFFKKT